MTKKVLKKLYRDRPAPLQLGIKTGKSLKKALSLAKKATKVVRGAVMVTGIVSIMSLAIDSANAARAAAGFVMSAKATASALKETGNAFRGKFSTWLAKNKLNVDKSDYCNNLKKKWRSMMSFSVRDIEPDEWVCFIRKQEDRTELHVAGGLCANPRVGAMHVVTILRSLLPTSFKGIITITRPYLTDIEKEQDTPICHQDGLTGTVSRIAPVPTPTSSDEQPDREEWDLILGDCVRVGHKSRLVSRQMRFGCEEAEMADVTPCKMLYKLCSQPNVPCFMDGALHVHIKHESVRFETFNVKQFYPAKLIHKVINRKRNVGDKTRGRNFLLKKEKSEFPCRRGGQSIQEGTTTCVLDDEPVSVQEFEMDNKEFIQAFLQAKPILTRVDLGKHPEHSTRKKGETTIEMTQLRTVLDKLVVGISLSDNSDNVNDNVSDNVNRIEFKFAKSMSHKKLLKKLTFLQMCAKIRCVFPVPVKIRVREEKMKIKVTFADVTFLKKMFRTSTRSCEFRDCHLTPSHAYKMCYATKAIKGGDLIKAVKGAPNLLRYSVINHQDREENFSEVEGYNNAQGPLIEVRVRKDQNFGSARLRCGMQPDKNAYERNVWITSKNTNEAEGKNWVYLHIQKSMNAPKEEVAKMCTIYTKGRWRENKSPNSVHCEPPPNCSSSGMMHLRGNIMYQLNPLPDQIEA
eukprot:GHVN01033641.1.p1 GENE.GHVN01033641.1~~GHVN01033641.1.p1  ORF type:complete len:734 (-),score=44.05 GHVN01033641.1:114-2174(-)